MLEFAAATLAAACLLVPSSVHASPAAHTATAGPQEPLPPRPARIHGRFVDEAGAPIEGVVLILRGRQVRAQASSAPVSAAPWQDPPPVASRADGSFELTFEARPSHHFTLDAARQGRAGLEWSWSDLRAGVELDLGVLQLSRAAVIVGHIVDKDGDLLVDGWRVDVIPDRVDRAHAGGSISSKHALVDPGSGEFRVLGLPPGDFHVAARRGRMQSTDTVRVTTVAGGEAQVELVFSGPDEQTLLQVVMTTGAPTSAGPAEGTVWAIAPDGARLALERVRQEPRRWSVPSDQDGPYQIVVEDPTFRPAVVEGVMPGAPALLSLTGTARLMLVVVDPVTGEEIDDYGLAVRYRPDNEARTPFELFPPGARSGRPHSPIALVPGDVELVLWSSDRPKSLVPLGALPAGHARSLRVELGRGLTLIGRVVDTTGAPVQGAVVELTQGAIHGHDQLGGNSFVHRYEQGRMTTALVIPRRDRLLVTDEAGAFRVGGIAAGQWAVYAHRGPFVHGTHLIDVQRESEDTAQVELVLPAFTEACVELTNFRGVDPQGFTLAIEGLWPPTSPFHPPSHRSHGLGVRPLADGLFAPLLVPLGRQRLSVHEDAEIGSARTTRSVWESVEDVTPCLQLTIDLRREH